MEAIIEDTLQTFVEIVAKVQYIHIAKLQIIASTSIEFYFILRLISLVLKHSFCMEVEDKWSKGLKKSLRPICPVWHKKWHQIYCVLKSLE